MTMKVKDPMDKWLGVFEQWGDWVRKNPDAVLDMLTDMGADH